MESFCQKAEDMKAEEIVFLKKPKLKKVGFFKKKMFLQLSCNIGSFRLKAEEEVFFSFSAAQFFFSVFDISEAFSHFW